MPLAPDSKKSFPSFQIGEVMLAEVVFINSFHSPDCGLNSNRLVPESATAMDKISRPSPNVSSLINALSGTSKEDSSFPFSAFINTSWFLPSTVGRETAMV